MSGALIRLERHDVERTVLLGSVRGSPPRQRGAALLENIVTRATSCVRRAADGERAQTVRYGRFLANEKVTLEALLAGWSEQTRFAAAGLHVLAIQDTSEINFKTTPERRRGLGEIGKGGGRGVLLHAMLALDPTATLALAWWPERSGRGRAGSRFRTPSGRLKRGNRGAGSAPPSEPKRCLRRPLASP